MIILSSEWCEPPDDPNEVECPRCESWHDPELPCIAMTAAAEDSRLVDRRA
jgi:hypothetical protein